jgi:hypothetical protein
MFLWIESYGLNRKPWACACTSHFLLFICFCFIVVALVFYNCVLCFVFFIVCFVHWRLCSPPTIRLFSCCSTFLFLFDSPFTFLLLNPHFAFNCPFILTHILLFCYPPIVQLEFFFNSRHHACTLALWLVLGSPFISLIILLCYLYFAPSHFCISVKCEFFLPLNSNLVKFSCFNSLFIWLCFFVS